MKLFLITDNQWAWTRYHIVLAIDEKQAKRMVQIKCHFSETHELDAEEITIPEKPQVIKTIYSKENK